MPINLREKLKKSQKENELKSIKKLIITKTHLQKKDIGCNDTKYQSIIDRCYDKLTLKKDYFDILSEKKHFNLFLSKYSGEGPILFMVKTRNNVFFLSLPYLSIKNNLDFFWDEDRLLSQSNDKVFVNHSLSEGFIVLMSEYGIETGLW